MCLVMLALMSQVGSPDLGGGCLSPEEIIRYFQSGSFGDFVGESIGSGILEDLERKESSSHVLGNNYG